jgi:hypothetical protein
MRFRRLLYQHKLKAGCAEVVARLRRCRAPEKSRLDLKSAAAFFREVADEFR